MLVIRSSNIRLAFSISVYRPNRRTLSEKKGLTLIHLLLLEIADHAGGNQGGRLEGTDRGLDRAQPLLVDLLLPRFPLAVQELAAH